MKKLALITALVLPSAAFANEQPVSDELLAKLIAVGEAHDCLITREIAKAELLTVGFTGRTVEKTMRFLKKQDKGSLDSEGFHLKTGACE